MNISKFVSISLFTIVLASCENSDDTTLENGDPVLESYGFVNANGESTVNFSGQTTRLLQAKELLGAFTTFGTTEASLDNMYTGSGFAEVSLNDTGKDMRSKTAASDDYFLTESNYSDDVKAIFDGYITEQVTNLLEAYNTIDDVPVAEAGAVGKLGTRLVNENGLELNQAFNKGLIGALVLDQIINNYLGRSLRSDVVAAHNAGTLVEGELYTFAEHYWDEAYGYMYGAGENTTDPNSVHLNDVQDDFLYKYVQRVNGDADFNTYAEAIFDAFIIGRAAIVAKDYDTVQTQIDFLKEKLSEVIGIRAVYYLRQGADKLSNLDNINDGSAFHDLSEGYGFVYSLQFTQNAAGLPYFSRQEVEAFITTLDGTNGFWDFVDDASALNDMAATIASTFNFTVEEAESAN